MFRKIFNAITYLWYPGKDSNLQQLPSEESASTCCATGVELLGYLSGTITVLKTDLATFCFNPFDDIFKQDRSKVGMLYAHTMVSNVNDVGDLAIEPGHHNTIGMCVTMDVDTKSTQAFCVNRNMTQDHAIHHMVSTQFTEVLTIVSVPEDIMVSPDQDLVTVEPAHYAQGFAVDHNITQVINFVRRPYTLVPGLDHELIHFLGCVPRT